MNSKSIPTMRPFIRADLIVTLHNLLTDTLEAGSVVNGNSYSSSDIQKLKLIMSRELFKLENNSGVAYAVNNKLELIDSLGLGTVGDTNASSNDLSLGLAISKANLTHATNSTARSDKELIAAMSSSEQEALFESLSKQIVSQPLVKSIVSTNSEE